MFISSLFLRFKSFKTFQTFQSVCHVMNKSATRKAMFAGDADYQAFLDTVADAHAVGNRSLRVSL
jgi:hypothetical protein